MPIYGFDNSKGGIYEGKIESPRDFITYGDKKLEEMFFVAMSLESWKAVKTYCKIQN